MDRDSSRPRPSSAERPPSAKRPPSAERPPGASPATHHFGWFLLALLLAIPSVGGVGAQSPSPLPEGTCVPGPTTLCFLDGRFAAEVDWQDADANSGEGQVFPATVGNAGFFYFDDSRYLELQVQLFDGCGLNGQYWVQTAGLSDYQQTLTITDTVGGGIASYGNTLGQYEATILDTAAFPCSTPEVSGEMFKGPGGPPPPLILGEGRFRVEVRWVDAANNFGFGNPIEVARDGGAFWFFSPDDPNVAVKIFDGAAINGSFWVIYGGPTSVGFDIEVTDVCTGQVQAYNNPQGVFAGTSADTAAFPATPSCLLLLDGFEAGDTSAWSAAVP